RGFYARGDTRTPMRISLVFIAANLTLNLVGIWMLREAALAWSTTVCAIGQCIALFWLCRRRLGQSAIDRDSAVSMVRIGGASLGMAAAVFVVQAIAPASDTWAGQFLLLGAMVSVGAATFVGLASLLRLPEMKWILAK